MLKFIANKSICSPNQPWWVESDSLQWKLNEYLKELFKKPTAEIAVYQNHLTEHDLYNNDITPPPPPFLCFPDITHYEQEQHWV